MTEEELIIEKYEQIEQLKKEIKNLRSVNIGKMMKRSVILPSEGTYKNPFKHLYFDDRSCSNPKKLIIELSKELYRQRLENKSCRCQQTYMTRTEKRTCAKFCDEVVRIFNNFIIAEYRKDYPLINEEDNE